MFLEAKLGYDKDEIFLMITYLVLDLLRSCLFSWEVADPSVHRLQHPMIDHLRDINQQR